MSTGPGQQQYPGSTGPGERQSLFNGAIAICAIIGAFLGWHELTMLKDQIRVARKAINQTDDILDQMRLEQRAWITIENPAPFTLIAGEEIQCKFIVKNVGKTPAKISHESTKTKDFKAPAPEAPFEIVIESEKRKKKTGYREPSLIHYSVGPDARHSLETLSIPAMDARTIKEIYDGERILYIYAVVKYLDVFHDEHSTSACYLFERGSGGLVEYEKYNDMD